jgi:hypothetical protein
MLGNLLVGNIGTHGGPIEVEDGSAGVGVASGAVEREAHPEGDEGRAGARSPFGSIRGEGTVRRSESERGGRP